MARNKRSTSKRRKSFVKYRIAYFSLEVLALHVIADLIRDKWVDNLPVGIIMIAGALIFALINIFVKQTDKFSITKRIAKDAGLPSEKFDDED